VVSWRTMDNAPKDGTLIDLNFDGIRQIDCYWHEQHNCWARKHGYPSVTKVFFGTPSGWAPRPDGLVKPYHTDAAGNRYIP